MQAMNEIIGDFGVIAVVMAFAVMAFAGFTKGTIGFALPMISISGIGSMMPVQMALAAIIIPGLVTNIVQSLRNGVPAAWQSFKDYWRINLALMVSIYFCAQLVTILSDKVLFTILGIGVTLFGSLQILGWRPSIPQRIAKRIEPLVGLVAGFFGGLSGVWGPPILMYLISQNVQKVELIRAQGISFLIGSMMLLAGHVQSGVLNATTGVWSVLMIVPAMLGLLLGFKLQDRLDQARFRHAVLLVLVLAGLNLLRRGLFG